MRIFISADIEGVVGVVAREQGRPSGVEYLPGVERTGAFTTRYRAEDIIATSRFLMFVTFARSAFS